MQTNIVCNTSLCNICAIFYRLVRLSIFSPVFPSIAPQIAIIKSDWRDVIYELRDEGLIYYVCMSA